MLITTLETKDRQGNTHLFDVYEEPFKHGKLDGHFYQIAKKGLEHKYFEFRTLELQDNRILIYWLLNHDHKEVSQKGIVKAMIAYLSNSFKKDIVSSTNNEDYKIDETEGRIPEVGKHWNKWKHELKNIEYNPKEDRFIYKWVEQ